MHPRLEDVPVYETRLTTVAAAHYNLVHVARKRLEPSIRIALPGLRTLDLILDEEAWIVVDRALAEVPVVAWLEFRPGERALHEPVPCRMNLYHLAGRMVVPRTLEAMSLILGERLGGAAAPAPVTPLPRRT